MKNRSIGIFDSGVGGLTVLKEITKLLPHEDIIYFGDTARVPYGNKSKSTVIKFSRENTRFLLKKNVKIVVAACNTSSSLALEYLKSISNIPILGVIEAGVNKALKAPFRKKIGVIGTKSTIASKSYERQIKKINRKVMVYSKSCPLFVPLVEEGILTGKMANQIVQMYLESFRKKMIDALVLGCTHYPLLKTQIAKFLKEVAIIDSSIEVAHHTKNVLNAYGLLNESSRKGKCMFYVSDEPTSFIKSAKLFLKRKISRPKVVHV